jgi:hypothetical protein
MGFLMMGPLILNVIGVYAGNNLCFFFNQISAFWTLETRKWGILSDRLSDLRKDLHQVRFGSL